MAVLFSLRISNPDIFFLYTILSCDPGKTEFEEGGRLDIIHLIENCVRVRIPDGAHDSPQLVWVPLHELMW